MPTATLLPPAAPTSPWTVDLVPFPLCGVCLRLEGAVWRPRGDLHGCERSARLGVDRGRTNADASLSNGTGLGKGINIDP